MEGMTSKIPLVLSLIAISFQFITLRSCDVVAFCLLPSGAAAAKNRPESS